MCVKHNCTFNRHALTFYGQEEQSLNRVRYSYCLLNVFDQLFDARNAQEIDVIRPEFALMKHQAQIPRTIIVKEPLAIVKHFSSKWSRIPRPPPQFMTFRCASVTETKTNFLCAHQKSPLEAVGQDFQTYF